MSRNSQGNVSILAKHNLNEIVSHGLKKLKTKQNQNNKNNFKFQEREQTIKKLLT